MHAHTLEYRQFRWFRVADGLFECLVACAREYCRPSYAKLSRVSTIQCILRARFARRLRFLNGKWPAAMCRSSLLIKSFKRFSSLWTFMQEKKRGKKRKGKTLHEMPNRSFLIVLVVLAKRLVEKERYRRWFWKNFNPASVKVFPCFIGREPWTVLPSEITASAFLW